MTDIVSRILTAIAGVFGFRSTLNPLPISDLKKVNGTWISLGTDPAFILDGKFYCGWNIISWNSVSNDSIPVKLYWDDGAGFSEEKSMNLASISAGESKYKATFHIPIGVKKLRLDPGDREFEFKMEKIIIKKTLKHYLIASSIFNIINQRGFNAKSIKTLTNKAINVYKAQGIEGLKQRFKIVQVNSVDNNDSYERWLAHNAVTSRDIQEANKRMRAFNYNPLISIILPVYNVDEIWLRKCIDSVISQNYTNWELCISDDASPKIHIKNVLKEYEEQDQRIKVVYREKNGHISENSNSALQIATGEFIALLDHDDELALNALFENVLLLNNHPEADIIYSDEDKISVEGKRFAPFFKPDWSPDLLLCQMYTCHLSIYRKSLIDQVGGFRAGYEGSQDFDLMLRVSELTNNIYHIPKILYHWRAIQSSTAFSGSTKDYTHIAGFKAVQDAIIRRGYNAEVESVDNYSNLYLTRFKPTGNPKVSIIIPTKDNIQVIKMCLESIYTKTKYANFEIVIIDNGSSDPEVFDLYRYWQAKEQNRFKFFVLDIPFNYSKLNNFGAEKASGELLLLLNNDVEIITDDWLDEMVGQAIRPDIGAVGACLYYPDNTIQHGGVVLGIGGVAGHSHKYLPSEHEGYFRRLKVTSNYTAITAACLMIKKEKFSQVGGLEEKLQVAFNDVDFCLKVWSAGYRNIWLPHVKLYHYESKSRGHEDTPEKIERFSKEIDYMKTKWSIILENDPAYNPNLTKVREDFSIGEALEDI
ncbi:glycosyl transferase family 2 [Paenibacillus sp. FSL H7-0737]|nr:glycosyl transferase family 2 [Paenibacillus sp. FSL H7-0737]